MKRKTETQNPSYKKNVKKIRTKHLTDTEMEELGGSKGSRKHLKKIKKSTNKKDYYT